MKSGKSDFQTRVHAWMLDCFGDELTHDKNERNRRFLEEALELVQSLGCTSDQVYGVVNYVYERPQGFPPQEVGGVLVTLAALCQVNNLDMHGAAEAELTRINDPKILMKIRKKQAEKPTH